MRNRIWRNLARILLWHIVCVNMSHENVTNNYLFMTFSHSFPGNSKIHIQSYQLLKDQYKNSARDCASNSQMSARIWLFLFQLFFLLLYFYLINVLFQQYLMITKLIYGMKCLFHKLLHVYIENFSWKNSNKYCK